MVFEVPILKMKVPGVKCLIYSELECNLIYFFLISKTMS